MSAEGSPMTEKSNSENETITDDKDGLTTDELIKQAELD
jgi:hypothetical protein